MRAPTPGKAEISRHSGRCAQCAAPAALVIGSNAEPPCGYGRKSLKWDGRGMVVSVTTSVFPETLESPWGAESAWRAVSDIADATDVVTGEMLPMDELMHCERGC